MPHLHWRGNALQDLAQQARKARDSSSSSRSGSSSDASSSSSSSSRSIASTVCAAGLSAAGETCPGSGAAACQALLPVSSTRPGSRPPRAAPPPAGTKAGAWRGGRKAEQAAGQGLALLLDGTPGRCRAKAERGVPGRRAGAEAALVPERRRRQASGSPSRAPCRDEAAGRGRRLRRKRARIAHGKNGDNAVDCGYVFPSGRRVAGRRSCRLAAGGAKSPKLPAEAAATSTHPGAE